MSQVVQILHKVVYGIGKSSSSIKKKKKGLMFHKGNEDITK